jgi:Protein of unknown function (DUF3151)
MRTRYAVALRVVSDDQPILMTPQGPPRTVLPAEPAEVTAALAAAGSLPATHRRAAIAEVVAGNPRSMDAWSALAAVGRDTIERYSAYRVGYHRGLDALRANGWRGSGYVRWADESNRGFLRCLVGLGRCAAEIGETDEAERIRLFLAQLDPSGVPEGE